MTTNRKWSTWNQMVTWTMTSRDPRRSRRGVQYRENSWSCNLAAIANYCAVRQYGRLFSRQLGFLLRDIFVYTGGNRNFRLQYFLIVVARRSAASNIDVRRWKIHKMGYNSDTDNTIRSAVVAPKPAKSLEIPRKFELIAVQSHPRSSTSYQICNFLLLWIVME